ncbi:MAG: GntR family transcriptional regulator [Clostridiales bacterium]|nr:GntR family transcriptional regulator [Clostridiales bacterium]
METKETARSINLTERVYQELRENILSGKYKEGEALTELGIAKTLDVSRTPVREALHQLEQEELVELRPNRGAIVKGITIDDIRDIYEIRSLIEGLAAARVAEQATAEELDQLEETLDLTQFYLERENYEKLESMDGRFHQQLYELCRSRMLRRILKDLHNYVGQSRGASLKTEGRAQESIKEHRRVLEAMRAHDPELAKERMTEHVLNTRANLQRIYQDQ